MTDILTEIHPWGVPFVKKNPIHAIDAIDSQVDGLYFVGAGTRPGNGVSGGLSERWMEGWFSTGVFPKKTRLRKDIHAAICVATKIGVLSTKYTSMNYAVVFSVENQLYEAPHQFEDFLVK